MWARAGGVYVYVGVHPGLCVYVCVFVYMCRTAYVRLPVRMCALVLWEYVYSRMQLCLRECMFLFLRPFWGLCNLARIRSVRVHNLARA